MEEMAEAEGNSQDAGNSAAPLLSTNVNEVSSLIFKIFHIF